MKRQDLDIDKQVSGYQVPATKSKAEAWDELSRKLDSDQKQKTPQKRTIKLAYWVGAAAASLIFMALLFGLLAKNDDTTLVAQRETQQTLLPDSTQVTLKRNTKVEYQKRLIDGARLVSMQGEAFFEVTKGNKFIVDFPGGKLKVLGTKFNIQSYTPKTGRVECYEGSVALEINKEKIVLTKGQAVNFTPKTLEGPFLFEAKEKLALPDNLYRWTDRSLEEILVLICAREGYRLKASPQVLQQRFSGVLNLSNSQQALTILTKAMNLEYQLNNNKLEVFEKK